MLPYFYRLLVILITLSLLTAACEKVDLAEDSLLIKNVSVIDIDNGDVTPNQSILIENGIISSVFESGSIAYKATREINAKDHYVMPGLWDMHIHLRGGPDLVKENEHLLPLYIANGVTTVRDAGGDLTTEVYSWKSQIKNGDMIGPDIFTSGPKLDGINARWEGSLELANAKDVGLALDSLQALGVDYVKIYDSRLSKELYLEILRQAEARGLKTTGHIPFSVMIDEAIDAGLDGIDHLYYVLKGASTDEALITERYRAGEIGFWAAVADLLESYDDETAQRLYKKMADNNVAVIPTLYIDEVLSFLQNEDHSQDEMLKYMGKGIQATYAGRLNSAMRRDAEASAFEARLNQHFLDMIVPMHKQGVLILAGTDNGAYNSFVYAGSSMHEELRAMVDSGLTPLEAIQTSITNGVRFFEAEDIYGNVQKGKAGDLLILSTNPLEDISHTKDIAWVVANGRSFSKEEIALFMDSLPKVESTEGE